MPTKKKRVGFIPRVDVMKLINKLSIENNLSNSKIVSILVEEALSMRGIFNKKKGKITQSYQLIEDHEQNLAGTSPGFIDNQKLTANITYIIGEREYWGKGIASYCINQILKKAKIEFALKKICAGCASKNIASIKVLKKNGFEVELIKRGFFVYDNEMMDCIIFKRLI